MLGVDASEVCRYGHVRRDGPTVAFDVAVDGLGTFTETFTFHGHDLAVDRPGLDAALRLLHLFVGISYLKTTLPPRVEVPSGLTSGERDLFVATLEHGLAELAHDHGTDLTGHFTVRAPERAPDPAPRRPAAAGALVPVGGGKDSIVTLEALRDRTPPPRLFAVNPKGPIVRTFDHAGLPTSTVTRTLDPRLFAHNDAGAINGHVPITAIVSAAAVVAAILEDCTAVVMSNEASADEATVVVDGRAVNHQWSKSSAFEAPFADVVRASVASDLDYVSFLRPASELAIAQRFSTLGYLDVFNSCNRAFHLQGETREWCGECPKCRFVVLMLAPFLDKERVLGIVGGRNLLDESDQRAGYEELLGFTNAKPFECVGEIDESRTAMRVVADGDWAGDDVVEHVRERLGPLRDGELASRLAPRGVEALPPRFRDAFRAMFG